MEADSMGAVHDENLEYREDSQSDVLGFEALSGGTGDESTGAGHFVEDGTDVFFHVDDERQIDVSLSEDDFSGQVDRLVEEYQMERADADLIGDIMAMVVERLAEKQEKEWSEDVLDAVTNMVISMFIQEDLQRQAYQ